MSQQANLVPIKNIKLAIDSMRQALEEQTPSEDVTVQFGILLPPSRGLTRDQAITYLNKCRQALSSFQDEKAAKMWFEVSLANQAESKLIACAQEKVNAKLAPPPEPKVEEKASGKEESKEPSKAK